MDHIVYLDFKSKEMESLLDGTKDIVLRGATGRKLPYGRASVGDMLYFVNNNGEHSIKAYAKIKQVVFTDKLTESESIEMVDALLERIKLNDKALKRFRGKRYLSFIYLEDIKPYPETSFDRSKYGTMDDWLLVENINSALN